MAYDDGYYYGQCKIVAVVDNIEDNGKTVLITTDDNKTYSGTIANKKCEFLLPPRTLYTVQKVSGESAEFTTKVEAGYGDCILVHLNTGYVVVKQGDIVGLDYIKAATDDSLKNKVPEAKVIKALNSSLTANNKTFQFAYDSSKGSYGYLIDGVFKSFSDATGLYEALQYSGLVTADMSYDQMLQALKNAYPAYKSISSYISGCSVIDSKGWNGQSASASNGTMYIRSPYGINNANGYIKIRFGSSIDLTSVKKISFTVSNFAYNGNAGPGCWIGLGSTNANDPSKYVTFTSNGTYTIDVSALSGMCNFLAYAGDCGWGEAMYCSYYASNFTVYY